MIIIEYVCPFNWYCTQEPDYWFFLSTEAYTKSQYPLPPDEVIGGQLHTNMFLPGAELRGPAKAW